jgi:hypothetical protein
VKNFQSQNAYSDFAKVIRTERRFIFDGKAGKFLAAVRAASRFRVRALKSGSRLYRAQVGSACAPENDMGIEEEHPHPEERMVPDPKKLLAVGLIHLVSHISTSLLTKIQHWLKCARGLENRCPSRSSGSKRISRSLIVRLEPKIGGNAFLMKIQR